MHDAKEGGIRRNRRRKLKGSRRETWCGFCGAALIPYLQRKSLIPNPYLGNTTVLFDTRRDRKRLMIDHTPDMTLTFHRSYLAL